jgi:hypothetical protein
MGVDGLFMCMQRGNNLKYILVIFLFFFFGSIVHICYAFYNVILVFLVQEESFPFIAD